MSAASTPNDRSVLGDLSDFIGAPGDAGEIRMGDHEPVSDLGVGEAVRNLLGGTTQTTDTGAGAANPSDGSDVIDRINSLLRGEISAAETYKQALDKIADGQHAQLVHTLRQIQEEHGRACQTLRDRIRELGGQAADSSGAWGSWSSLVQGTMGLFGGDKGAVKALKEGEEHGLKDFSTAVPNLDPTTAQLVQNQLIPAQQRHIGLLDQIIATI